MERSIDLEKFKESVLNYYRKHKRDLPWRVSDSDSRFEPYKILVSEMMLQQTQVSRVIPKYQEFLQMFPNIETLAEAQLGSVIKAWSGLGYNRRAKFLWQAAKNIAKDFNGQVPQTIDEVVTLPGIGPNTAGAILVYAFNRPAVFVETNIRTVYIHHFFTGTENISDKEILELLPQTIDKENPREFYWALMDYGSYLKLNIGNMSRFSKMYVKQSQFNGSKRQIRGKVVKILLESPCDLGQFRSVIRDDRLKTVLADLVHEGIVRFNNSIYELS